MIEAHVARLTRLRLSRLFCRKKMPGMARITRGNTKSIALFDKLFDFIIAFQTVLMATAAAFDALCQRHRLPVKGGHGLHCRPGKGVLSLAKLRYLLIMALGTGVWGSKACFFYISSGHVLVAVASDAIGFVLAV
jgi:hypothetical protein